jgi:hypothetical protein
MNLNQVPLYILVHLIQAVNLMKLSVLNPRMKEQCKEDKYLT